MQIGTSMTSMAKYEVRIRSKHALEKEVQVGEGVKFFSVLALTWSLLKGSGNSPCSKPFCSKNTILCLLSFLCVDAIKLPDGLRKEHNDKKKVTMVSHTSNFNIINGTRGFSQTSGGPLKYSYAMLLSLA